MDTILDHKAMTAHLRGRLRHAGIAAHCSMQSGGVVRITPKGGPDARFTDDEQETISVMADVNRLTFSMGLPVLPSSGCHGHGFHFYMPAGAR